MRYAIALLVLFFAPEAWAQENMRKELKGKITSDISGLEDIYVVNRQTEKFTATGAGGYFSIAAQPGDTLMFSSIQFKGKQVVLQPQDFGAELFFVRLEAMIHPLDEVKISRYNEINAVTLGIIPANQKKFTPAERKLAAADGSRNQYGTNTQISFDGILNGISGKTAMLRKEVEIERKETIMKRIEDLFEEKFFTDQLKIPAIYVKGFLYYIVENNRFTAALDGKNKTMLSFALAELAVKYKDSIAIEKE
jgi:hypothetical protein